MFNIIFRPSKKEAPELCTTSKDLESFTINSVNLPVSNTDITESSQNGNSYNQSTNAKRNHENVEESHGSKKGKNSKKRKALPNT